MSTHLVGREESQSRTKCPHPKAREDFILGTFKNAPVAGSQRKRTLGATKEGLGYSLGATLKMNKMRSTLRIDLVRFLSTPRWLPTSHFLD